MLEARVIVLGASRYKFPDEKTGELIEGCKVHYCEHDFINQDDSIGAIPQYAMMEYEFLDTLRHVPGVYNAQMTVSLRGKKPTLKITDFEFVAPLDFKKIVTTPQTQTQPSQAART